MLILSRKLNETICIGNHIRVTVMRLGGNVIRLGIEAPEGVPIYRQEVIEAILRRQEAEQHTKLPPAGGEAAA